MKQPIARSSRANAPFNTTNRAPEIFWAPSKSIRPSASPISKCCLGANANLPGVPTLRTSTLPVLIRPERHILARQVRNDFEHRFDLGVDLAFLLFARRDLILQRRALPPSACRRSRCPSRPWLCRSLSRRRCGGPARPAAPSNSRAACRRARSARQPRTCPRSPAAPAPR